MTKKDECRHFWKYSPLVDQMVCVKCMQFHEWYDILLYVGASYYTKDSFINESRKMGCCRRVPQYPDFLAIGKSRVFLAYCDPVDKETAKKLREQGKTLTEMQAERSTVFAYYTVTDVIVVADKPISELAERGVEFIKYEEVYGMQKRGCGSLQLGGCYLVSDIELLKEDAKQSDLKGSIVLINPEIPYPRKHFRGYKYCYGDKILRREPVDSWFPTNAKIPEKVKKLDDF